MVKNGGDRKNGQEHHVLTLRAHLATLGGVSSGSWLARVSSFSPGLPLSPGARSALSVGVGPGLLSDSFLTRLGALAGLLGMREVGC